MALPSTGYAVKDRTAGGSLTNFSPPVKLSEMPSDWWDLVGSETDGTKGRAAKDDGTELATDWIDFDPVAKTGWLRFLWTGTFSSVTPNILRIYPPVAANSSVASGDTYGSDNAYDSSWEIYLPLDEAVNTNADGYKDRTVNANHGQGVSMALTETAGQVGTAQDFDGSADYIQVPDSSSLDITTNISFSLWLKLDNVLGIDRILSKGNAGGSPTRYDLYANITSLVFDFYTGGVIKVRTATTFFDTNWNHVVVTYDGSNIVYYKNGAAVTTNSQTGAIDSTAGNDLFIAVFNTPTTHTLKGLIDEFQIHSATRSADWIAEEFAATDDNSVYWGVWVLDMGSEVKIRKNQWLLIQ